MAIKQFDKATCKSLRSEVEDALKTIGKRHGVDLKCGNGKFSQDTFEVKLIIRIVEADGSVTDKKVADWNRWATLYGFKTEDLGKEFSFRSRDFEIVGLKPSNTKFPVLCKELGNGGGTFKFDIETVKTILDR